MRCHRPCGCSYWPIINAGGKGNEKDAPKDSNFSGVAIVVMYPFVANSYFPRDMFSWKYPLRDIPRYDSLEIVCQWTGYPGYDYLESIPAEAGARRLY